MRSAAKAQFPRERRVPEQIDQGAADCQILLHLPYIGPRR